MDYYKYIKYKTKYLNLKYDNNQYGGGIVPCDKAYKNTIGTCWAVALQVILSSGHLTSDPLNEIMKSFQKGDDSVTTIKENMELFIEEQIKKIQDNTELTNAFANYKIFEANKIDFLKDILRTFIERYYNKFINIPFTSKPPIIDLENPETKKKRCEYRMARSFQNLFDFSHIRKSESEFGEYIYGQYLFCNLLSIFLLDYKVSFTNYYDNFNRIIFDDINDLGILIQIHGHVCCLFICNGEEKFYNDSDEQISNCKWKDLLLHGTGGKQLYITDGCLKFIDDIKTYDGDIKKISKVLYLTVISKHTRDDTTLDIDIKRLLELKKLDEIKDMEIQILVGDYYYRTRKLNEARKFYGLAADQGFADAQYNLGVMLYKGEGGDQNIIQAKKLADKAAKKDHFLAPNLLKLILNDNTLNADTLFMLGCDLYDEHNFSLAREKFKLAADQGHAKAQYMLGKMLYNGEGDEKDHPHAREYFTLAADQGHAESLYELGKMLYYGDGGYQNITEAIVMCTLAANKGYAKAQYMLGMMLYNAEGGKKDIDKAREMFESAANQGYDKAKEILGKMPA